jgi:anti-sigma factor RsiW
MMDCTRAQDLLDDYVDGDLSEAESQKVRDHLKSCAACARSEADLHALLHRAAELPVEIDASRELWPGIRDKIAAGSALPAPTRRSAVAYGWMAAAAVLLVLLSSAVTLWVVRHGAPTPVPRPSPASELVALRASEPDYIQARKALVSALDQRRRHLSPQTVKIIEQNLAAMDRALHAMKTALDKDPGNRGLAVLIESTYRQEIQLLMQAASLPTNA